jgi:hypothetical protein
MVALNARDNTIAALPLNADPHDAGEPTGQLWRSHLPPMVRGRVAVTSRPCIAVEGLVLGMYSLVADERCRLLTGSCCGS